MLSFSGPAFAQSLRVGDVAMRSTVLQGRIKELNDASWDDLESTGITEAILELVDKGNLNSTTEVSEPIWNFWILRGLTFSLILPATTTRIGHQHSLRDIHQCALLGDLQIT